MARLSEEHRNIVPVYDAAICPDGRPYLVMQYCPKPDLAKRYKSGSFTVAEVLSTGVQLAGAVESAHRQGILHRDIKPANVLTTRSGRPALPTSASPSARRPRSSPGGRGVDPVEPARSCWPTSRSAASLGRVLAGRHPLHPAGPAVPAGTRGSADHPADLLSRIPRSPRRRPVAPTRRAPWNGCCPEGWPRTRRCGSVRPRSWPARCNRCSVRSANPSLISSSWRADPGAELAELTPDAADHTRVRPLVIDAQGSRRSDRSDGAARMRGVLGPDVDGATRARSAAPEHTVLRAARPPAPTWTRRTVAPPGRRGPARPTSAAPAPANACCARRPGVGAVTLWRRAC